MADGLFDPSRLYNVLKEQGLLPRVSKQYSPEVGEPSYYPVFNKLFTGRNAVRSTVAHEMTHAVQANIIQATAKYLAEKEDKTEQEKQYLSAYQKLMLGNEGMSSYRYTENMEKLSEPYRKSVEALYGKPLKSESDKYRTSPDEAQAFGVGNMSISGQPFMFAQKHMDPSYATEFDILLSMYDKLPSNIKQATTAKRKDDIGYTTKWFGKQNKGLEQNAEFSDLFSDPFAPTVD
jgi:hypothetical protein